MLNKLSLIAGLAVLSSAAFAQQAAKPTDPQIAHIAYTAGEIDIQAAEVAKSKSSTKEVKAFADDMIRDHKAVNEKALALVKKLGVTPEDNDTSRTLKKQADAKLAELKGLQGKAFDKAYADNEVAFHKQVNGALQNALIPSAQNAELKGLLQTGLKIFEGHEQHAEMVAKDLK
jgi:putative membrane protein